MAAFLLARPARADPPWLLFRGSPSCSIERDELASRILQAVAGAKDPALTVEVTVADDPPAVRVRLLLGDHVIGVKQIETHTCNESLDAVVAVVALALSSAAQEGHATSTEPVQTIAVPASAKPPIERETSPSSNRTRPPRLASVDADRVQTQNEDTPKFRLFAGMGIDMGTIAQATLLVSGGAALALGRGELRAVGRYGVPSTREEVSGDFERVRTDFGATALEYCRDLDRARWVSACGGLELSFKRSARVEQPMGEPRNENTSLQTALGPVAGVALVLREVMAQPRLELSAHLPVVGRTPAPGFRAALAGGVLF